MHIHRLDVISHPIVRLQLLTDMFMLKLLFLKSLLVMLLWLIQLAYGSLPIQTVSIISENNEGVWIISCQLICMPLTQGVFLANIFLTPKNVFLWLLCERSLWDLLEIIWELSWPRA